MPRQREKPVIAVIGGGFTGAAFALHFRQRHGQDARIVVFEPRTALGAGLAYATQDPAHRVNVPAGRMTLYPQDKESFLRFVLTHAEDDPGLWAANGEPYPRRSLFGAYVRAQLQPLLTAGLLEHRQSRVMDVARDGESWVLRDSQGFILHADSVVIAATHPAPGLPAILHEWRGHARLVADATVPDALAAITPDDTVLIVGNGLTAADVVASLKGRGHRGHITSLSRRGLRSRGHPSAVPEPFGDFSSEPSRLASHLLRSIRRHLAQAGNEGIGWHAVLDAVRIQGFAIWQGLEPAARRRIVRHARPFWDAHRFRIAPQVEEVLDKAIAKGTLSIRAARLTGGREVGDGFHVGLAERGGRQDFLHVNRIVVTTGPEHGRVLRSQAFMAALADGAWVEACPTGLGLACDLEARAVNGKGQVSPGLFIAGPLARGSFGELMGLPQVTDHAIFVADKVASFLKSAGRGMGAKFHGDSHEEKRKILQKL
ncbi:FAD/NAD(P)-binding protein [Allorhizobium undicola]|uniref:FAD/NAD(P)-binding protein n=1 Tax=Allorhizobium undicola TaxID=78527 RepID=UPI000A036EE5|nr:FAD/NAD(P)-binding protein [Allorhizobium undicola]